MDVETAEKAKEITERLHDCKGALGYFRDLETMSLFPGNIFTEERFQKFIYSERQSFCDWLSGLIIKYEKELAEL